MRFLANHSRPSGTRGEGGVKRDLPGVVDHRDPGAEEDAIVVRRGIPARRAAADEGTDDDDVDTGVRRGGDEKARQEERG